MGASIFFSFSRFYVWGTWQTIAGNLKHNSAPSTIAQLFEHIPEGSFPLGKDLLLSWLWFFFSWTELLIFQQDGIVMYLH